MKLPVTIDPRYHEAVIFDLDGVVTDKLQDPLVDGVPVFESTVALVRRLQDAGVATAVYSSRRNCEQVLKAAGVDDLFPVRIDGVVADELGLAGKPDPALLLEAARRLGVGPELSVVVEDADVGVEAGRNGGFALVIGIDRTVDADELLWCGADAVVADLADVAVRTGDRRMSEIPNALGVLWSAGRRRRRPGVGVVSRLRRNVARSCPIPAPPGSSTERLRR